MNLTQTENPRESVSKQFIGRDRALNLFNNIILYPEEKNGIYYFGQGGIGKTWILKKILRDHRDTKELALLGIIDFFDTINHTIRGLQTSIITRLNMPAAFESYFAELKRLESPLKKRELSPSRIVSMENRIN